MRKKTILLGFVVTASLILVLGSYCAREKAETKEGVVEGLPQSEPEGVGFSSSRLARIRPVIDGYVDRHEISGAVMLIARNGKIVYHEAVGMRDIEAQKPMETNAIFRIASMTKPVTAVAVMMLYEEGHFLLSDPVSKYIPIFKNPEVAVPPHPDDKSGKKFATVPAEREITVKDLLTHTSGITSQDKKWITSELFMRELEPFLRPEYALPHPDLTLDDEMKILATLPLSFHPGTQWGYNWSTDVLGYLVEVVSGMTLDQFFQERIFTPLCMKDTCFFLPEEKASRLTAVYAPDEEGELRLIDSPAKSSWVHGPKRYLIPRGGLLSTVADYVRFSQMLLNLGELDGVRLLSRKTVELMTENHLREIPREYRGLPKGYGYGLHLGVCTDPVEAGTLGSMGSYFWSGGHCTYFWIDPKEQLICIFMTQRKPSLHKLYEHFRILAYQAIED